METKIGTSFQYRKSFTRGRGVSVRSGVYTDSAGTRGINADTFTMSSQNRIIYPDDPKETELRELSKRLKEYAPAQLETIHIAKDDHEGRTKFNFDLISYFEKGLNKEIPKKLEEAGVPSGVTFEFDYNLDSKEFEITDISDEEYCEKVKSALNRTVSFPFIACASRVMNGYISSVYYPAIEDNLKSCFEQDISDLYIDENGKLCGANENLQKAIEASKKGEAFSVNPRYIFPAQNIEGIIKRLISDENITPNISHMGYDGQSIYTDDGEFKFGKDFDPSLFNDQRYVMRGTMSLRFTVYTHYDSWLENEKMFY